MKKARMIEVLAPAGSFESMQAAVNAGADAVYMGGTRFGARAYAKNPETGRLLEAIDYVHLHGKKLYLTVNTLLKEEELSQELYEFLVPVYEAGVDALIVQDLGVWQQVRRQFPQLPLHASTQMTITGVAGAREARKLGAARIVTARELSIEEIHQIHEQVEIEIEAFVHGALCYSYSGQCLFSSLAGGRSGNRGRCAGPCRLPYEAWEGKERLSNSKEAYLLNLKDLCGLDSLGELLDAGVCSLKIEGRMKSPRYVAGVVSIYRKYVDLYQKVGSGGLRTASEDQEFLLELFDRGGFSDGYFHRKNGRQMLALSERPFRPVKEAVLEELDQKYVNTEKKEKIKGNIRIAQDFPAKLSLTFGDVSASVEGERALPAKNRPISKEDVRRQIEKLGDTPFVLEQLDIELSSNVFFPVGRLNELRRAAVSALEKEILRPYRRTVNPPAEEKEWVKKEWPAKNQKLPGEECPPRLSVLVEEKSQFLAAVKERVVSRIYLSMDSFGMERLGELIEVCRRAEKECFLALPRIWRGEPLFGRRKLQDLHVDGFLLRTLDEGSLLEDHWSGEIERDEERKPLEFVADASLYTFNREARSALAERGFAMDTAPLELNRNELFDRGLGGSEVIVYGRLPMMISSQCIQKTLKCCGKQGGNSEGAFHAPGKPLLLRDKKQRSFPVKRYCLFCYNVIYNHAPLWLAGELPTIAAMNPRMVRLQFTTEGPEETSLVIRSFETALLGGSSSYRPELRTRGHFHRGVE